MHRKFAPGTPCIRPTNANLVVCGNQDAIALLSLPPDAVSARAVIGYPQHFLTEEIGMVMDVQVYTQPG